MITRGGRVNLRSISPYYTHGKSHLSRNLLYRQRNGYIRVEQENCEVIPACEDIFLKCVELNDKLILIRDLFKSVITACDIYIGMYSTDIHTLFTRTITQVVKGFKLSTEIRLRYIPTIDYTWYNKDIRDILYWMIKMGFGQYLLDILNILINKLYDFPIKLFQNGGEMDTLMDMIDMIDLVESLGNEIHSHYSNLMRILNFIWTFVVKELDEC